MDTAILPLAITMMAGPQILSDIIFATSKRPIQATAAFTLGVAVATTLGVLITTALAGAFNLHAGTGQPSGTAKTVEVVLVVLLAVAALRTYRRREAIEPPKWLGKLQAAPPRRAFTVAVMLILFFPSDIMILLTTGIHLASHGLGISAALPFIGLTTLVAALPLIALLVFRKRAATAVPAIRQWMDDNTWLVSIIVYVIFILLIVG